MDRHDDGHVEFDVKDVSLFCLFAWMLGAATGICFALIFLP